MLLRLLRGILRKPSQAVRGRGEQWAIATSSQADRTFAAGDIVGAVRLYRAALDRDPGLHHALNNLALCHLILGDRAEAERCFESLRSRDPAWVPPHANLAAIALRTHQFTEAGQHYDAAVRLLDQSTDPASTQQRFDLLNSLGVALQRQGRPEKAVEYFREALELQPGHADTMTNLAFALLHRPGTDCGEIFAVLRDWARRHEAPILTARMPHANSRDPSRRLRIGYCSGDFYDHAVANFIEPILRHHDRCAFEVFAYVTRAHDDALTKLLRSLCDRWCPAYELDDERLAQTIRDDGIDILVDLSGHTLGHRLPVFARKPAPVQITYLGYPTTTGLDGMDYRITDAVADPPRIAEQHHSERLLRMPRSQWCYRPKPTAPPVSPLPADTYGAITFGSFNNPSKLNRFTLGMWARVLAAVPDSRLKVVSITDVGTRERIAGTLKAEGIVPDRLQILSALPDAEFWRVRGEVDIVLDATPYNGTTTTCEALWAGLPVVTLAGSMGAARSSASLLTAIGLPELIAEEESAFVGIARDWASPTRRDRLRALRGELRERMLRHGLCDGPGFVAALEAHYRSAWMVWCGTGISANST